MQSAVDVGSSSTLDDESVARLASLLECDTHLVATALERARGDANLAVGYVFEAAALSAQDGGFDCKHDAHPANSSSQRRQVTSQRHQVISQKRGLECQSTCKKRPKIESSVDSLSSFLAPARIIVWNVNGLRALLASKFGRDSLRDVLSAEDPDALVLLEHQCPDPSAQISAPVSQSADSLLRALAGERYDVHWCCSRLGSYARGAYAGVVALVRQSPLRRDQVVVQVGLPGRPSQTQGLWSEGRAILLKWPALHLAALCVYSPHVGHGLSKLSKRLEWERGLSEAVDALQKGGNEVLVMGDLNIAPCLKQDHFMGTRASRQAPSCSEPERAAFFELCRARGLTDGYRHFHPEGVGEAGKRANIDPPSAATVWPNPHKIRWKRYDFALVDNKLLPRLTSVKHLSAYDCSGSDHRPIMVELARAELGEAQSSFVMSGAQHLS